MIPELGDAAILEHLNKTQRSNPMETSSYNIVRTFFRFVRALSDFPVMIKEDQERRDGKMEILRTTDLKKYYGTGENRVKALDGVNLSVEEGEFVAVVGTSGSGKSTLLHMLGGLDYATSGSVTVAGKDIFRLNESQLTVFRRRNIGFIFQNYNLIPILNVYENIVLPIELDGEKPDRAFVREIMRMLGIEEKRSSLPGQLSGGQQQRVAIARALASKPAIILADEPTGNLDSRTSQEVLGLLKLTGSRFHQTIVMITHNEAMAQLCDRVIRIEDGRICKGQDFARGEESAACSEAMMEVRKNTEAAAGFETRTGSRMAVTESAARPEAMAKGRKNAEAGGAL